MKIDIVGRNYKVTEKLKTLLEKKISKFEKFFEKGATAKVVCSSQKDRFKMELNLSTGSMFIRSEVESDNMYANLDLCLAKVEKQIIKYMGKNFKKARGAELPEFEYFDELPEVALPKITKRKAFELVPMSEEEALIQMDNVGNDFFVFMNSAVNRVCLLYRREDGDIGIIETL